MLVSMVVLMMTPHGTEAFSMVSKEDRWQREWTTTKLPKPMKAGSSMMTADYDA
jgi:hypothetical protein